jgi:hypothetical protein
MAALIEGGMFETVQERQHVAMGSLELGAQVLGGHVASTPQLSGVPAVGVEVGGHAAFAGSHSSQGGYKARLGRREMGQQVANGPAFVRAGAEPIVGPNAIQDLEEVALGAQKLLAERGFAVGQHDRSLGRTGARVNGTRNVVHVLRQALHRHLVRLASEADAEIWERVPLTSGEWALAEVADWGQPKTGPTGPTKRDEIWFAVTYPPTAW